MRFVVKAAVGEGAQIIREVATFVGNGFNAIEFATMLKEAENVRAVAISLEEESTLELFESVLVKEDD